MERESEIVELIERRLFPGPDERLFAVYLFGSAAHGETNRESDADLAFLGSPPREALRVFEAAQDAAVLLDRDVDLVDLTGASTVLRARVVGSGRRIHTGDEEAVETFEMYALSDYARLEEERVQPLRASAGLELADDVLLDKVTAIERCLGRVRELFADDPSRLDDQTVEDAIVLNLQRACEASIDLAMHAVATRRLGIPQDTRGAFGLLAEADVIGAELATRLQCMVGFRNIAVHDYQKLSRAILLSILRERLPDFEELRLQLVRSGAS